VHTLLLCYLSGIRRLSPVNHDMINRWGKPMGGLHDEEEIITVGMTLLLKPASYIVLKSLNHSPLILITEKPRRILQFHFPNKVITFHPYVILYPSSTAKKV